MVGDRETRVFGDQDIRPGYLNRYSQMQRIVLPNALIIRRGDMRVLMTQFNARESGDNFLPFVEVARNPERPMISAMETP